MQLKTYPGELVGAYQIIGQTLEDKRGTFSRLFCPRELETVWKNRSICQINYSSTGKVGALRGLHFQKPPQAEAKLVKCIRGRVWDVGVDLRPHSSTFLKWQAVELDSGTHNAFFIPEGCAHGFQVMEPDSELLYLHSAFYHAEQEGGLLWNDPVLNISWPLPVVDISDRDQTHQIIKDIKTDARLCAMACIPLPTKDS